jgi:hypothetical protein
MTRAEVERLLELVQLFDEQIASDEPAHLACVILGMHCNVLLECSSFS